MWLELDHIIHPMLRAKWRSSPKSREGLARVLPCNYIGLALTAFMRQHVLPSGTAWQNGGVVGASDESLQPDETELGQHICAGLGLCSVLVGSTADT